MPPTSRQYSLVGIKKSITIAVHHLFSWPHTNTHTHTNRQNALMNKSFVWWPKSVHELYSCKLQNCTFAHGRWWPLWGGWWWASHSPLTNATASWGFLSLSKISVSHLGTVDPRLSEPGLSERSITLNYSSEADHSELATAHSQIPQFPSSFSETFHSAKTSSLSHPSWRWKASAPL